MEQFEKKRLIFIPEHRHTSLLLTKWWNHDVVMKKLHTSALSSIARVIKED